MSLRRSSAAEAETPNQRARRLLREVLSPTEQAHFVATGQVVITGSEGGKYRIDTSSYVGNVKVLSNVRMRTASSGFLSTASLEGVWLCAHLDRYAQGGVPEFDHFVAQVLAIKADERQFVRTAYIYARS